MNLTKICRFCLKSSAELLEVTAETYEIVKKCLDIELQVLTDSKICRECLQLFETFLNFKLMCLESENHLIQVKIATVTILEPFVAIKTEDQLICKAEPEALVELKPPVTRKTRKTKKESKKESQSRGLKECDICKASFRNIGLHLKFCKEGRRNKYVKCDICHQSFLEKNLESHKDSKHLDVQCATCLRMIRKSFLPVHMLRHKDPSQYTEEEKIEYQDNYCDICNLFVPNLQKHKYNNHRPKGIDPQARISCEKCGKLVARSSMAVHASTHKKRSERFVCDICGKRTTLRQNMRAHMEYAHLKIRNAECKICNIKFFRPCVLVAHNKKHHEAPSCICSICQRAFTYDRQLKQHMITVHIKKGNFVCEVCSARHNSETALQYHFRTAHGDLQTEKSAFSGTCVCGIEFLSRSGLRQHFNDDHTTPSGTFKCSCGREYLNRNRLANHITKYHKLVCVFREKKKVKDN